ncbi:MAG: hypothetical protein PHE55_20795 [Methylococcaceae bacterium]|nr:hypothetical protein [Methylococcaceae bacterium]
MQQMIRTIRNKLDGKVDDTRFAVFVRNGVMRVSKATTNLAAEAMERRPDELAGIYDINVLDEWIADDLAAMGVRP